MATLTILGKTFEIAPFKLGDLKLAAPHIDAINATAGALTTMEGMLASAEHSLAIIAIGLRKIESAAAHSVESLLSDLGFDDLPSVSQAVADILRESGLSAKAGEAQAPSEPADAEGASQTNSGSSSLSSSPTA